MDEDEDESIAFFEYARHEMQVELCTRGSVKRILVTRERLMADRDQREAYKVDKPWPPQYYRE